MGAKKKKSLLFTVDMTLLSDERFTTSMPFKTFLLCLFPVVAVLRAPLSVPMHGKNFHVCTGNMVSLAVGSSLLV